MGFVYTIHIHILLYSLSFVEDLKTWTTRENSWFIRRQTINFFFEWVCLSMCFGFRTFLGNSQSPILSVVRRIRVWIFFKVYWFSSFFLIKEEVGSIHSRLKMINTRKKTINEYPVQYWLQYFFPIRCSSLFFLEKVKICTDNGIAINC